MGQVEETTLQETTFKELFDAGRLPSGAEFELMPDTVEIALAVAEVSDPFQWKKKALQAFTVTKTVAGLDVQEAGPNFVYNMLDTDVIFLSLAWTTQLNGTKLDIDEGVPCPTCNHLFRDIDFGNLKLYCRGSQGTGPSVFAIEGVNEDHLPKSLQGGKLAIGDMTWKAARRGVSEQSWENIEAVKMHRVLSGLRLIKGEAQQPRDVMTAESKKMKATVLRHAAEAMDSNIPHFDMQLNMKCTKCDEVSVVPFTQGLG